MLIMRNLEAAFLEINVRIKEIIKLKTGEDIDGVPAMQKAFSVIIQFSSCILTLFQKQEKTYNKDIWNYSLELLDVLEIPKHMKKYQLQKLKLYKNYILQVC